MTKQKERNVAKKQHTTRKKAMDTLDVPKPIPENTLNSTSNSLRNVGQKYKSSSTRNIAGRHSFSSISEKLMKSSSDLTNEEKGSFRRVRSFTSTSVGFLNGNFTFDQRRSSGSSLSYRSSLSSDTSSESASALSCSSSSGYYRVPIIGGEGVGKSSLETRFMNSEYTSQHDCGLDNLDDTTLAIVLDNEESTVEFLHCLDNKEDMENFPGDAYIVVFSVHDKASFEVAAKHIQYLRYVLDIDRPIILVANKVDLVRRRQVTTHVAKQLAKECRCKYIETSAVLNHKVDELLVGVLKQIKLKLNPDVIAKAALQIQEKQDKRFQRKGPKRFFNKLFRRNSLKTLSKCDNLFDL